MHKNSSTNPLVESLVAPVSRPDASGSVIVGVVPGQGAAVVQHAAGFAAALGVAMVCVWVDPAAYMRRARDGNPESAVMIDPDAVGPSTDYLRKQIEARLADCLASVDIEWSFDTVAGEPARELARLAARVQASMIVVGTREPGISARLEELLTGSVAVHLAHHQPCPVLVIPLHPRPFGRAE